WFDPLLMGLTLSFYNFRMCRALMPGDEESMSDEAIWETLPHFWVAISMVFLMAATIFTLLKLSGSAMYNTFVGYPPEVVKKMAKKDLAEEVH
ncbi:hypothetical protein BHE74_00023633, partial [Ensete ventricosum]